MSTQSIPAVVTDASARPAAAAAASPASSQAPDPAGGDRADLRLVIEEDKAAGTYVYKTIDPVTGKVISQIPREQLLMMREAWGYKPGSVVDSRG
ncbi:MAG TPA: hypothetical protein VMU93_01695 [Caulobacteraceae bacterium]|nr:hypothetical protein [Caulobacteraceae bacterium]